MTIQSRQEFFAKLVHHVERTGNVYAAVWNGVHLWPVFRISLIEAVNQLDPAPFYDAVDAAYRRLEPGPPPDLPEEETAPGPCLDGLNQASSTLHLYYASPEDHFFNTPDGVASPIIDGWCDASAAFGSVVKIALAHRLDAPPRARPVLFAPSPSAGDVEQARRDLDSDPAYAAALALLRGNFMRAADACAPGLAAALNPPFSEYVAAMLAARRRFDPIVEQLRPSAAFVVCWYGLTHMALVWACNVRGVPTAEICHSGIPEYHHGYSHLSAIPPEGCLLLPRAFLCWDHAGANAITRWIPPDGRGAHRAVAAAPPHLPAGRRPQVAEPSAAKTVLVGLGGDEASGLTPMLAETMALAPPDWRWLVRCHPLSGACDAPNVKPEQVTAILRARGVFNFEVDAVTACDVAAALNAADHLLTAMSTLAFDALHLGVPTTFTGPMAPALYGWLAAKRLAYFAEDPAAAADSIARGWSGLDRAAAERLFVRGAAERRAALQWVNGVPPLAASITGSR